MSKKDLIEEKALLLQEIHHRVKNNFQIIISLVELQIVRHPESRSVFIDLISRIRSMSLIYENLLLADNLNYIKFSDYVKILIDSITTSLKSNINFIIKFSDDLILNLEQATSIGIAINEILINIVHHAFKEQKSKKAEITLYEKDGRVYIAIEDNGIGIDSKFLKHDSSTLGLNLVKMLIKNQLEGNINIINDSGTKIFLDFKKD